MDNGNAIYGNDVDRFTGSWSNCSILFMKGGMDFPKTTYSSGNEV